MSVRSNIETLKIFLKIPPVVEAPRLGSRAKWLLKQEQLKNPTKKEVFSKWELEQMDQYLNKRR